ncbi:hypothetical protein OG225_07085 [Nocardia sp. NBC_01377]|uniref:hypothetical protein n=1 Tax=Nocardia sp. NBC_01377 TaxID=2903595 RepID=UPI00324B002A
MRWIPRRARHSRAVRFDAASSPALPCTPVPGYAELEADALARASALTEAGASDEFCGYVLDEFYHRWHAEAVVASEAAADDQRRVDRALIDAAAERLSRTGTRAQVGADRAARLRAQADSLWADYFPGADREGDSSSGCARSNTSSIGRL